MTLYLSVSISAASIP